MSQEECLDFTLSQPKPTDNGSVSSQIHCGPTTLVHQLLQGYLTDTQPTDGTCMPQASLKAVEPDGKTDSTRPPSPCYCLFLSANL